MKRKIEAAPRTAHTPGPWDIHAGRTKDGGRIIVGPDRDASPILAHVLGSEYAKDAEVEANASLISAAPELLAVVRTVVAFFEYTPVNQMSTPQYEMLDRARAALAKAEAR